MADVVDAIAALDLEAPWPEVREHIRLVLPRRRPLPDHGGILPQRDVGSGIVATLGVDIGPAMLFVSTDRLEEWEVTADEAYDQAFANVRSRVEACPDFALIVEDIADTRTLAFQSREGWASALVAAPELLCRVLGRDDGIILAPMRDLLLHLPPDAERELADWILGGFAEADMNGLDVPPLALVDGRLGRIPAPAAANAGSGRMH